MAGKLIITNGDVAVSRLAQIGAEGEFLAEFLTWRDPLHDGPVPAGLVLEALALVRAQFLAHEFGRGMPQVSREFSERNATARNHGQYERVELWFEHDLYDQLQLIEILNFFDQEKRSEGLFLVQADDYLGTMPAEALEAAAGSARLVTAEQRALAREAWAAFTHHTPEKLAPLAAGPTPALPHLGPALVRLLQELPATGSGLSMTEERILAVLASGQRTVADVFAATQAQETARFLGDAAFFRRLDRLAFAPQPLIGGLETPTEFAGDGVSPDYRVYAGTRIRIMENGRLAHARRFDHAAENKVDRWIGGTHIASDTLWRRDPKTGGIVRPSSASGPAGVQQGADR